MNKNEYLDRLSRLLADISYEEHEEALSYYREYIEDAGAENEQRVIEELGTPEQLAQEIRDGLLNKGEASQRRGGAANAPEAFNNSYRTHYSGTDTDRSYQNRAYTSSGGAREHKYEKDQSKIILIIILLVLTSPIWFSLACALIGTIFACIAAIIGIGAGGIVCIATGIALIAAGISALMSITGFALIGAGCVTAAVGIALIILTVWLFGWALPALIRFIKQTAGNVSNRKKEARA